MEKRMDSKRKADEEMEKNNSLRGKKTMQNESLSLLALACFKEEYEPAKTCLNDPKLDLSGAVDEDGRSVLHYCVQNRTTRFAELLIIRESSLVRAADINGHTALQLSVIAGNAPMAEYLLENGADVHHVDKNQHSVAHWVVASQYKDLDTFRKLVDLFVKHSGDLSSKDRDDATPLHYAVQSNDSDKHKEQIIDYLVSKQVDVDSRDIFDRTPLIWAATTGSEVGCRSLLKAGADVNANDSDGITALHCAASWGHVKCIEILTKEGANVDCTDVNGCTPIFYSVIHRQPECTRALIRHKANTNHQDNKGRSVTHCAAAIGDVECLEILKANKTKMWLQSNKKGHYPIHEAAIQHQTNAVKYLLEKCSKDRKKDVNIANNNGRSCLHVAAMTGNFPLLDYLVKNGADKNCSATVSQNSKVTPYDSAIAKKQLQCADYLLRHGAKSHEDLNDDDDDEEKDERKKREETKKKKPTSEHDDDTDKDGEEKKDELSTDRKREDKLHQKDTKHTPRKKEENEKETEREEEEEEKEEEEKKEEGHPAAVKESSVPGSKKKKGKKNEYNQKKEDKKKVDEDDNSDKEIQRKRKDDDEGSDRDSDREGDRDSDREGDRDDFFDDIGKEKKKEQHNKKQKSPRQPDKEEGKMQSKGNPKTEKKTGGNKKEEAKGWTNSGKKKGETEKMGKKKLKGRGDEREEDKMTGRRRDKGKDKDASDTSKHVDYGGGGTLTVAQGGGRQLVQRPATKKRLYKPYFSLIQEQVRVFEMKRLASLKMQKSMKFEHQGNEKSVVRRLARDYNEEARPEDRVASSQFNRIKDFQKHLQEEFLEAEEWEKRLKQIEKIDPLYDSRPGRERNIYARSNGVTYRLQPKRRDDGKKEEKMSKDQRKRDNSNSRRRQQSADDDSSESQSRYDDDYDSSSDNNNDADKDNRKKN